MTSFATSSIRPVLEGYLAGRVKAERVVAEVASAYYRDERREKRDGLRPIIDVIERAAPGVVELAGAANRPGFLIKAGEGGGGRAGAGWVHRSRAGRDSRRVPLAPHAEQPADRKRVARNSLRLETVAQRHCERRRVDRHADFRSGGDGRGGYLHAGAREAP